MTFLFALLLSMAAWAAGGHDYYALDDQRSREVERLLKDFAAPGPATACAETDQGKIRQFSTRVEQNLRALAKDWEKAMPVNGHEAEERTQNATFDSGIGGHAPSRPTVGRERDHRDTTQRGRFASALGGVMGGLQDFSMLCRGHRLNDPQPDAVPRIQTIREQGALAVQQFRDRSRAATEVRNKLKTERERVAAGAGVVRGSLPEGDCRTGANAAFEKFAGQLGKLDEKIGVLLEQWRGQAQAYEQILVNSNNLARVCEAR